MAIQTRYASFDLHQTGKSASDRVRDQVTIRRGDAASGAAVFTDANRDFTADGITTSHIIQILDGGGNIQREVLLTAVGTTTVDVAGGDFDTTANNLRYRVFLPPTDVEIVDDPKKRGLGLVGWQEMLTKIEGGMSSNFISQAANVTYAEGLTQQSVTYDPTGTLLEVTLSAGDIQIGAVEIKDGDADIRATVDTGATYNRLIVQLANATSLVDIGSILAAHLGPAPASAVLAGFEVIDGVPAEETAGDIATPWMASFRQLIPKGFDLGQDAQQIIDVASALLLAPITAFAALPATSLPISTGWTSAENFHHTTFVYVVATIDTDVVVRAEGTPDGGTTIYNLDDDDVNVTKTANGAFMMQKANFKAGTDVRLTFVSATGGTAAVITPFLIQGN